MVKICPKCNSKIKIDANFCENCGYQFNNQRKNKNFDIFKDDLSNLNKRQLKREIKKTRKTNIGLKLIGKKFILGIFIILIILIITIIIYNNLI